MKYLHKSINVKLPDGTLTTTKVEEWGRNGTMSPTTYIIQYNGKRYTPYASRLKGFTFTLNGLFKLTYGPAIEELISHDNPLLKLINKDS